MKKNWLPQRSPFGLIQEDFFPDQWKTLIICMMLNRTSRKQVEKVIKVFFELWSTPQSFISADKQTIVEVCKSLGFANRRTDNMLKMTKEYVENRWTHVKELPGIGEYASRSWEIFYCDNLGSEEPNDHALTNYYKWKKRNGKEKNR